MQLRTEIQLKTMMKAMDDVILPAIDSSNQLALEQAQLVKAMMGLMAHQLPLQFDFDRDELQRLIDTADKIQAVCLQLQGPPVISGELYSQAEQASTILSRCTVNPALVEERIRVLRRLVGEAVQEIQSVSDHKLREKLEGAVVAMSREQLLRDRALMIKQGWEVDPESLPTIESLLDTA